MTKKELAIQLIEQNPSITYKELMEQVPCGRRWAFKVLSEFKCERIEQGYEITENDKCINATSRNFKSKYTDRAIVIDEFLKLCEVDMDKFEIKSARVGASDVTMSGIKSSTGKDKTYRNYNISITLVPISTVFSIDELAAEFKQAISNHEPVKYKPVKHEPAKSGNMAVISIHDLHYGQMCWKPEAGENYNIKIAEDVFIEAVNFHLSSIISQNPEKIIFTIGSDFFNVNSESNTTAGGTPQDEDSRWMKTYVNGRKMAVSAVDILRNIAPVYPIIIRGNHDLERAFHLGDSLYCWYRNCDNVDVDNTPSLRKYVMWGKCLLGFSHGKEEIKGSLPGIMALEAKHHWSRAEYREFDIGHVHHFNLKQGEYGLEEQGVRVRFNASLATLSNWAKGRGYSGLRSCDSAIWNKEKGNIARFSFQP